MLTELAKFVNPFGRCPSAENLQTLTIMRFLHDSMANSMARGVEGLDGSITTGQATPIR